MNGAKKQEIADLFEVQVWRVVCSEYGGEIDLSDTSACFGFYTLELLADLVGTRSINIRTVESDPECTPGSPSRCDIIWIY